MAEIIRTNKQIEEEIARLNRLDHPSQGTLGRFAITAQIEVLTHHTHEPLGLAARWGENKSVFDHAKRAADWMTGKTNRRPHSDWKGVFPADPAQKPRAKRNNEEIARRCGVHRTYRGDDGEKYYDGPDYCNDLNSMREAELKLDDKQLSIYIEHILKRVTIQPTSEMEERIALVTAPPAVKVAAYIATINDIE